MKGMGQRKRYVMQCNVVQESCEYSCVILKTRSFDAQSDKDELLYSNGMSMPR